MASEYFISIFERYEYFIYDRFFLLLLTIFLSLNFEQMVNDQFKLYKLFNKRGCSILMNGLT